MLRITRCIIVVLHNVYIEKSSLDIRPSLLLLELLNKIEALCCSLDSFTTLLLLAFLGVIEVTLILNIDTLFAGSYVV